MNEPIIVHLAVVSVTSGCYCLRLAYVYTRNEPFRSYHKHYARSLSAYKHTYIYIYIYILDVLGVNAMTLRSPDEVTEFLSICLILPAALWPWG
jgi:hypothetical protein